jgi:hypothetical protein
MEPAVSVKNRNYDSGIIKKKLIRIALVTRVLEVNKYHTPIIVSH